LTWFDIEGGGNVVDHFKRQFFIAVYQLVTYADRLIKPTVNVAQLAALLENKLQNLNETFLTSNLEHQRFLLCWIFPKGLTWSYPGVSNTHMSPFYRTSLDLQGRQVRSGALVALSFEQLLAPLVHANRQST
jgi:hypothetical protein